MASLWHKSVAEITYDDVEQFCKQSIPEGVRLEYKREFATSLSKSVCAFANTLGGLIIFGFETDDATNQPKWPPRGVPRIDLSADRITQICTDGVYPPVPHTLSKAIDNPLNTNTVLAVLRIDQSPTVPHAIDQSTKVLVRVNDIGKRFDLADVERIAHMLAQRARLDSVRDHERNQNIARVNRLFQQGRDPLPMVWCSIGPEYPWQNICHPQICLKLANEFELRRGPRGAIAYDREIVNGIMHQATLVSVSASGAIFRGNLINKNGESAIPFDLWNICAMVSAFFRGAQAFYKLEDVNYPGLLRAEIGVEQAANKKMRFDHVSDLFPDDSFSVEQVIRYEELSEFDFGQITRPPFLVTMLDDIAHAFGLQFRPS